MATVDIDSVDIADLIIKKNMATMTWIRPYANGSLRVDYEVEIEAGVALKQLEAENKQLQDWIVEKAKSSEGAER